MKVSKLQRSVLSGVAGFLVYGGWAFWLNASHGTAMGISAGAVQGSYSFVLTLTMTLVMEHLMASFVAIPARGALTVALVSGISFSVAYSLQWLNGTPEILLTILPGFFIGVVYCAVYVTGLQTIDAPKRRTDGVFEGEARVKPK